MAVGQFRLGPEHDWCISGQNYADNDGATAGIQPGMIRPTIIVAETEPLAALSTRKLVLEAAKFNVLTAHSSAEAVEILRRGSDIVAGAAIVGDLHGAETVVAEWKRIRAALPVIFISPSGADSASADYRLQTHDPQGLVELCRKLFGDPRQMEDESRKPR